MIFTKNSVKYVKRCSVKTASSWSFYIVPEYQFLWLTCELSGFMMQGHGKLQAHSSWLNSDLNTWQLVRLWLTEFPQEM